MAEPQRPRPDGSASAGPLPVEEIADRAARLGITVGRVLEELHAIAFADIRRIIDWGDGKLTMKASSELLDSDAAAIAEIVASAKDRSIYRVKMHDKTPALALMTRILEKFTNLDEQSDDDSEEARDFLLQELDRLAAEIAAEEDNRESAENDSEPEQSACAQPGS
jgi:hypothetical protein